MQLIIFAALLMVGTVYAQANSIDTPGFLSHAHQTAQLPAETSPLDGKALAIVNSYAKEIKEEIGKYDWAVLFVNAALAAATGLLFWKTRTLAHVAAEDSKRQARETEESLRISNAGVRISERTAHQAQSASFLDLYPIVEKHHSPEIARLRQFAREDLPGICASSREENMSLKDYDKKYGGNASKTAGHVANYYESLGMLVEFGQEKMLPEVTALLLDMIHVSAYDIWEIFFDNLDVIYPHDDGMDEWGGSFEYLYQLIAKKYVHPNPPKPLLKRPRQRLLKSELMEKSSST